MRNPETLRTWFERAGGASLCVGLGATLSGIINYWVGMSLLVGGGAVLLCDLLTSNPVKAKIPEGMLRFLLGVFVAAVAVALAFKPIQIAHRRYVEQHEVPCVEPIEYYTQTPIRSPDERWPFAEKVLFRLAMALVTGPTFGYFLPARSER